ncbi:MAG: STAS domain-containing protein [Candidatus Solibacter sp.]|nr:STAS domain-containing protein [Candidatus Solibacter sp.]
MKILLLALVLGGLTLNAQVDPLEGLWQGYDGEWAHVSRQLVALAETIPAEKFAWRPAPGVRSTSVKVNKRDASVEGMYLRIIVHANEHMGQLIAYARVNGIAVGGKRQIIAPLPVYHRTMSVEAKQLDSGVSVVTITGRLAMGGETERLDATVKGLLQKDRKKFVLDITALDYVDSSGIGMLVSCLTNVKKAGGELKLAGANPRIRRIFAMTGVDTMMPMCDTLADATA